MRGSAKTSVMAKVFRRAFRGRHASETQTWEEATAIRERVIRVLKRYASYGKVIIAGHGMMIQATTGKDHPQCGEIVEYHLE